MADRIWIEINYRTRFIAVRDNGRGSTIDRFVSRDAPLAEALK